MNRGAQLLSRHVERGDQRPLAVKLGMDEGYLSRVVRGIRVPGLSVRKLIRDEFGIALETWDEPALEQTEPAPAATGTDDAKAGS